MPLPIGVPPRIDLPVPNSDAPDGVVWQSATVVKVRPDGNFELRIDNAPSNQPTMIVSIRPERNTMFETYAEEGEDLDEGTKLDNLPKEPGARVIVTPQDPTSTEKAGDLRARLGTTIRYQNGQKVLVVTEEGLLDAQVIDHIEVALKGAHQN